jgi:hypothetical protein
MRKLEAYKSEAKEQHWTSEANEQHWKHKKKMSDSLLQFFWKNNFRALPNSSLIASSILVCFGWFKILWVHHLGLYIPEAKMQ